MKQLVNTVKKDLKEFVRSRKNILFLVILLVLALLVFGATKIMPGLLSMLMDKSPDMVTDMLGLTNLIGTLFPEDVKASMGIFASDICVFYTIIIALVCHGLLPKEIKSGVWIQPINAGYTRRVLVCGKSLVYGLGAALPAWVVYHLYYLLAMTQLEYNFSYGQCLLNGLVLAFVIFSVTNITILLSVAFKNSIGAAITVIGVVIVAPDLLTFLSFGKYFPTYLFTFIYTSGSNAMDLVVPIVLMVLVQLLVLMTAMKKVEKVEIERGI